MKHLIFFTFLLATTFQSNAHAFLDKLPCPILGGVQYDNICSAHFQKDDIDDEELQYRLALVNIGAVPYFNEYCKEGVAISLAYTYTYLHWKENLSFSQSRFNTLSLSISGFSHRLCDWTWRSNVTINVDTDQLDFEKYLSFDLLLWGRYEYRHNLAFHLGFYAITGLKIDRVYPVIGFDWHCRNNINVHAVFPVDLSVLWEFRKCWETGATIHFFQSRHRVGRNEPDSRALFLYETYGVEFTLNYNLCEYIHFNVHVGHTLGGKLKIADRHYDERHHFKFDPSLYFGGEAGIGF